MPLLIMCIVALMYLMGLVSGSLLPAHPAAASTPTDMACLSGGKNYTTMFVQTSVGLDLTQKLDGTWKLKLNHVSRNTMW